MALSISSLGIMTFPLFCPEKPGPLGQVRDRWLCLGLLCLKDEHRTSNVELWYAFGVSILLKK
jgi:hypothetical protein